MCIDPNLSGRIVTTSRASVVLPLPLGGEGRGEGVVRGEGWGEGALFRFFQLVERHNALA